MRPRESRQKRRQIAKSLAVLSKAQKPQEAMGILWTAMVLEADLKHC